VLGDVTRHDRDVPSAGSHVGYSDAGAERRECARVVLAVADKRVSASRLGWIVTELSLQQSQRPAGLVGRIVRQVHVHTRAERAHPPFTGASGHRVDGLHWDAVKFADVQSDVAHAGRVVVGELDAGKLRRELMGQCNKPLPPQLSLIGGHWVHALHPRRGAARRGIVRDERDGAVLSEGRLDRPLALHELPPSGRTTGASDQAQARSSHLKQRAVSRLGERSVVEHRVVEVEHDTPKTLGDLRGKLGERLHGRLTSRGIPRARRRSSGTALQGMPPAPGGPALDSGVRAPQPAFARPSRRGRAPG